ncbi:MAG: branched-chain amino acid ABC transporter permease, partial [Candidatus Heimdallarchaeota archaeon]
LARSRYGLILKAIREDELAASSSGINVNFYKVSVFTISGVFAGFAGGLFAQISGAATSSMFDAERSFEVIIFTILGGIGTIAGGVVGTFILYLGINIYVSEGFLDIPTIETLSFGLILVLILKYQPRGIVNTGPKLRNALLFGSFWAVLVTFYDAGEFSTEMLDIFNPSWLLQRLFGEKENGLFGLDVWAVEGLLILYFAIGVVIGYYGPDLMQKIRLKIWGVWPNLGKFDPPK